MPLRSRFNQYLGLNIHFHQWIQTEANLWRDFHGVYMVYLLAALKSQLLPIGYTARIEQGLQIQATEGKRTPQSDISIYDLQPTRPMDTAATSAAFGTVVVPILELLAIPTTDVDYYNAVVIYPDSEGDAKPTPIAWLELLSPTNKYGAGLEAYRQKREKLLRRGIVFVELDYLHGYLPTFAGITAYDPQFPHAEATPFHIIVTDPRPTLASGQGVIYQFTVDEAIPTAQIPLSAGDLLAFDFDAAYQKMFVEVWYGNDVDYSQLPLFLPTFFPTDQHRLLSRLLTINTHADALGEHALPFPREFDRLPADELVARLKTFITS